LRWMPIAPCPPPPRSLVRHPRSVPGTAPSPSERRRRVDRPIPRVLQCSHDAVRRLGSAARSVRWNSWFATLSPASGTFVPVHPRHQADEAPRPRQRMLPLLHLAARSSWSIDTTPRRPHRRPGTASAATPRRSPAPAPPPAAPHRLHVRVLRQPRRDLRHPTSPGSVAPQGPVVQPTVHPAWQSTLEPQPSLLQPIRPEHPKIKGTFPDVELRKGPLLTWPSRSRDRY